MAVCLLFTVSVECGCKSCQVLVLFSCHRGRKSPTFQSNEQGDYECHDACTGLKLVSNCVETSQERIRNVDWLSNELELHVERKVRCLVPFFCSNARNIRYHAL
jgi:hypothetical protein